MKYPTGVENHGGTLRLWFIYKGIRVRESLGVPDTPKNRKVAGELRTSICYAIKTGNFNYAAQFPESANLSRFGESSQELTLREMADRFLSLKETEVAETTIKTYRAVVKNVLAIVGPKILASSVNKEKLMEIRKELLTGYQLPKQQYSVKTPGRSAVTVNNYMTSLYAVFQFGVENGYLAETPFKGMQPLRETRVRPDPLTRDEFVRLIMACRHEQNKNMLSISVYTGIRPGELCGLAWEDVDLKAGTIMIRRNFAVGEFTVPKTLAGTNRLIYLIGPAIDALRSQAHLTRLSKEHQIKVKGREYGSEDIQKCTFVFLPAITARTQRHGEHMTVDAIRQIWDTTVKRAGIRHRKSYQTRHTYACWSLTAGANPTFIATQMGHADAQMLYQVYGKWMKENDDVQINLLNEKLSEFAPPMPQRYFKKA